MKKHVITMYETSYPNEIKEGIIRVIYKGDLIQDIQKRICGELTSMLYKELVQEEPKASVIDIIEDIKETYSETEEED